MEAYRTLHTKPKVIHNGHFGEGHVLYNPETKKASIIGVDSVSCRKEHKCDPKPTFFDDNGEFLPDEMVQCKCRELYNAYILATDTKTVGK